MAGTPMTTQLTEAGQKLADALVKPDHEFKSDPHVFWPAARGDKAFEFRKDDRGGYHVGQTVRIRCYEEGVGYTGDQIARLITNVLYPGQFGLQDGYCILSLRPINTAAQILLTPEGGGGLREGERLTNADHLRIAACYHREKLPAGLADELLALADEWSDEVDTLAAHAPKTPVPGNDAGMREVEAGHAVIAAALKVKYPPSDLELDRLSDAVERFRAKDGDADLRRAETEDGTADLSPEDYADERAREILARIGMGGLEEYEEGLALNLMEFHRLGERAALSPPTGSAGDDETGVREAAPDSGYVTAYLDADQDRPFILSNARLAAYPPKAKMPREQMDRLAAELGTTSDADTFREALRLAKEAVAQMGTNAHQPPKAETPAGVGDKSLIELAEAFKASCEIRERLVSRVVELEAALSIAPAARAGDGVEALAREFLKRWDRFLASDKNHECAHRFLVEGGGWEAWESMRAALTAAPAANGEGA